MLEAEFLLTEGMDAAATRVHRKPHAKETTDNRKHMQIRVRVINGKTVAIKTKEDDNNIKKHQKKAIEERTNIATNQQRLTTQGKQLGGVRTMKNYNRAKATPIELTLNLQGGTSGRTASKKKSIRTLWRYQRYETLRRLRTFQKRNRHRNEAID